MGDKTGSVASAMGWKVGAVGADADALVAAISRISPRGPLVHLAGTHRRGRIAERLTATGIPTEVRTVYDQVLLPLSDAAKDLLAGKLPAIVPLFSPRTAAQFAHEVGDARHLRVVAMSEAVKEILFILQVLNSVGVAVETPVIVRVDNMGAIFLAENPNSSSRMRHIDIRWHFTRNLTKDKVIFIVFCVSAENKSDGMTKNVPQDIHERHTSEMVMEKDEVND